MTDYRPDEFSASFGGMITHTNPFQGGFQCLVYDLGPNVIACGEGATRAEAIENTRKVRWGYLLRLDFLFGLSKDKRGQISEFLGTLTSHQKEIICDLLEEVERRTRKEATPIRTIK